MFYCGFLKANHWAYVLVTEPIHFISSTSFKMAKLSFVSFVYVRNSLVYIFFKADITGKML
jgi:hypothetical protein